jgi:hypothetical protein
VRERCGELGPISALAALCLYVFGHERPAASVEIARDGLTLRLDAKP